MIFAITKIFYDGSFPEILLWMRFTLFPIKGKWQNIKMNGEYA